MSRTIVLINERLLAVGSNIRKWRNLKGLKQEVLASALEISAVAISKIETGKTDIPLNRLFEIASILEIPVEMLFMDPLTALKMDASQVKL